MSETIHRHLALLHQQLLDGRLPRNLNWDDATELVAHLGKVEPHGGGEEVTFIVGSQREFFKRPHGHDLPLEEISRLRKLLKAAAAETPTAALEKPIRMVVVIDHHAAQVYQDRDGSRPESEVSAQPHDSHGYHRHLIHRKEAHYQGDRVPEDTVFYEDVARLLAPANEVILLGHATGKSNAASFLVEFLKKHHPDLARRVTAVESVDLSALTPAAIEQIAKRHRIASHMLTG